MSNLFVTTMLWQCDAKSHPDFSGGHLMLCFSGGAPLTAASGIIHLSEDLGHKAVFSLCLFWLLFINVDLFTKGCMSLWFRPSVHCSAYFACR